MQRVQLSFVPDLVPVEVPVEEPSEPTWADPDDYETPAEEARMLAALCSERDRVIIDAGAGCGNITQALPWQNRRVIPVEANPKRFAIGQERLPKLDWLCKDFLEVNEYDLPRRADLVIGNPPFSLLVPFINHSFENLLTPEGRVIFLLPGDTFHKPTIIGAIKTPFALDERKILGRIAYLKDGVPERGRQVYDSIFILKRSKRTEPKILDRRKFKTPF